MPASPALKSRPLVALAFNVLTPYRLAFHKRLARELHGLRLASLFTHDAPDQPWKFDDAAEINPVQFGTGYPVTQKRSLAVARAEWARGGAIIRWLRENQASALVLGGYADPARLRVIRWCHANGVPCFIFADSNIRGDFATGFKRTLKQGYVGWVTRHVAGLLPCGRLGQQFFERYGASPERCWFMPYEPDYGLIEGITPDEIERTRARHNLDPRRRRAVTCSRLVDVKRVELAIDAFVAAAAQRPEWDLVIIGDGPLRAQLEARVPEPLRERVRFTGFIGDQREISAIYRASDLLLHPADYEPWALVINEAAAAGLAIVATDVTGAAYEIVADDVNGRLVKPGDQAGFRDALLACTAPDRIDKLKQSSAQMLERWRRVGDPVDGLRRALKSVNIDAG